MARPPPPSPAFIPGREQDAAAGAAVLAQTVTRPALRPVDGDAEFRRFLHDFLAFSSRLLAIRSGFGVHLGLSGAAYTTLIALAHLDASGSRPGIRALAAHLHLSDAFVTNEITALQRLGLVAKHRHLEDKRRVVLAVTPQAQEMLRALAPLQAAVNDQLFAALDAAQFHALGALLPQLLHDADRALALQKAASPTAFPAA